MNKARLENVSIYKSSSMTRNWRSRCAETTYRATRPFRQSRTRWSTDWAPTGCRSQRPSVALPIASPYVLRPPERFLVGDFLRSRSRRGRHLTPTTNQIGLAIKRLQIRRHPNGTLARRRRMAGLVSFAAGPLSPVRSRRQPLCRNWRCPVRID